MKRNSSIRKSKSFQMRRSPQRNNSSKNRRRDVSVDRGRIVRSYEDILNNNDSDNDSSNAVEPDESERLDLTQWMGLQLPNLMWMMDSSSSSSTTTFQTPVRTRSKFKPSWLLQKRKEGLLVQQHSHTPPSFEPPSRRHSILALLILLTACYLLMSLTAAPTTSLPSSSATTYYYVNLTTHQPLQLVTKMLQMHAFAYQQQQPTTFAGVCGYPTFQQDAQRQALTLLVQMGLQEILQFDVCPPIEAVLHRDPHYVLLEEQDMPSIGVLKSPAWQAAIAAQSKPVKRDSTDLWRQVLSGESQQQQEVPRIRRLR